jgi:hypothetical protein
MAYSESRALTARKGFEMAHHPSTHEEIIDPVLGYQPNVSWFTRKAMQSWVYFVTALAGVREGDGTVLDHSLVFAHSDQSLAKTHSILGLPMMTAGGAGGRLKTGIHVMGGGAPGTRVGLTMMRVMGLPLAEWGVGSMKVSKGIDEILV